MTSALADPASPALAASFLGRISAEARAGLLSATTMLRIPAGEVIFHSNDGSRVGVVLDGVVRAYLAAPDGRQLTAAYWRPGATVGTGSIMRVGPFTLEAVGDCTILELDVPSLLLLARTDFQVAWAFFQATIDNVRGSFVRLALNAFGSTRERLAGQLLELGTEDRGTGRLIASVTQQELADALGTVREVVARVLREFREDGLVATRVGEIEIIDQARLAALVARGQPSPR